MTCPAYSEARRQLETSIGRTAKSMKTLLMNPKTFPHLFCYISATRQFCHNGSYVMSECTALLGQRLGFGGVSDSGFSSCTAPTYYCRSKYFYSQCPQVWNLIGTE